jgi:hypothetical protein
MKMRKKKKKKKPKIKRTTEATDIEYYSLSTIKTQISSKKLPSTPRVKASLIMQIYREGNGQLPPINYSQTKTTHAVADAFDPSFIGCLFIKSCFFFFCFFCPPKFITLQKFNPSR